jgi:hypothetical protein
MPDPYFSAVALRYLAGCLSDRDGRLERAGARFYARHPTLSRHPAIGEIVGKGPAARRDAKFD